MFSRYIFAMISLSYLLSPSLIMGNIEELNNRNKRSDNSSQQNEDLNATTGRITILDVTTKSNTITLDNITKLTNKSNDNLDQNGDSIGTTDHITTSDVTTNLNTITTDNIAGLINKSNDSDDTAGRYASFDNETTTESTTTEKISSEKIDLEDTSDFEDIFSNYEISLDVSSHKSRAENTTSDIEHAVADDNETNVNEDETTTVKYVETERISERKCDEYIKVTRWLARRTFWSTSDWSIKFAVARCVPIAFIRGGIPAKRNQFPHMAAVGWKTYEGGYIFNCGGSLISENFVMTAGHCTFDPNAAEAQPSVIFIGENHIDPNGGRGAGYTVNIKSIHKHPDYKPPKRYNDIALLELGRHLPITLEIRPACLGHKNLRSHISGIATGWGLTDSGEKASDLQLVTLTFLDNDVCDSLLIKIRNRNWQGFSPTQMCAGELIGGKDTCQGDSGAPLQVSNDYCTFHVVGVTSFGYRCAEPNRPAIYTRVSEYVDWIESVVWPGEEISNA